VHFETVCAFLDYDITIVFILLFCSVLTFLCNLEAELNKLLTKAFGDGTLGTVLTHGWEHKPITNIMHLGYLANIIIIRLE